MYSEIRTLSVTGYVKYIHVHTLVIQVSDNIACIYGKI